MLKTRSVQSERRKDDGLRILATRFRGRGSRAAASAPCRIPRRESDHPIAA